MPPDASSSPRTFLRIPASEWKRKAVHMGSFGAAFLLPYLTPKQAALMAIGALLFNMFVLPKLMPSIIRREGNSGYLEILMYPAAVLATILAFSEEPDQSRVILTIAVWGALAIGDGILGICHTAFRGNNLLRWNDRKSFQGFVAGIITMTIVAVALECIALGVFLMKPGSFGPSFGTFVADQLPIAFAFSILVGLVESIWFGIVDNLTIPIAVCLMLGMCNEWSRHLYMTEYRHVNVGSFGSNILLAVSTAVIFAAAVYIMKKATLRGAILGLLFAFSAMSREPWLFAFMLGFFLLGVMATRYGKAGKESRGIAEAQGGRRDGAEVFGALAVMVWLSPLIIDGDFSTGPAELGTGLFLIIISPLIAKTMDTVSSEMGKAIGGTTISLRTFKVVPPGTDGGVSLAGTVWGLAGATLLALLILPLHWGGWKEVGLLVAFAVAANLFESYWAFWAGPRGVDDGPHTNFMMTLFAATLAWFWWM